MVDRWRSEDIKKLFLNKHVVIIGDSIQRGLYKDLVRLLQTDQHLEKGMLKTKGEKSFLGDKLIEGGNFGVMHNGKNYREVRQYHTKYHVVTFYMVTACYSSYVETVLEDLMQEPRPDIIFMSSCVWDITRNGPDGRIKYHKNLQRLVKRILLVLTDDALFVWNTATPLAEYVRGGFMLRSILFMNQTLRHDVVEANFYAKQVMTDNGLDVLDLHYHFRNWMHLREKDGIHWNSIGHRKMTNLVLDHVCEALGIPLPRKMWQNDNNNYQNSIREPCAHCQKCNMVYPTSVAFVRHMEVEHCMQQRNTVSEPLKCVTQPSSVFSTDSETFECTICKTGGKISKAVFQSASALFQHIRNKHRHGSMAVIKSSNESYTRPAGRPSTFECAICKTISLKASFLTEGALAQHVNTVHSNGPVAVTETLFADVFECDICTTMGKVSKTFFHSESALAQHKIYLHALTAGANLEHNRASSTTSVRTTSTECQLCKKPLSSHTLLLEHLETAHAPAFLNEATGTGSSSAGLSCLQCGIMFPLHAMMDHLKTHSISGNLLCECGQTFHLITSLEGHKNRECLSCKTRVCNDIAQMHLSWGHQFCNPFVINGQVKRKREDTAMMVEPENKLPRTK